MHRNKLLIVDDDTILQEQLNWALKKDFEIVQRFDRETALNAARSERPDLVLLDLHLPPTHALNDGLSNIGAIRRANPDSIIIVMTGDEKADTPLHVIEAGAYDYFRKPVDIRELHLIINRAVERQRIERENVRLRREIENRYSFSQIIGYSELMIDVFTAIHRVADSNATVIVRGESGTGKELVARAIHYNSSRSSGPFIGVNCAALPENLIEAELFGHEKGAFTGAAGMVEGRFERADGGTLFLDEIGTLGLPLQSKLLRVLEDREVTRLGGKRTIKVDIRLITATNENLEEAIAQGHFREDLYYRINVVPIYLPPLRDRREDIPLLLDHFIRRFCDEHRVRQKHIDQEAINYLMDYQWKGNVRELENLIQRLVVMTDDEIIGASHLPPHILNQPSAYKPDSPGIAPESKPVIPESGLSLDQELARYEYELLRSALDRTSGVKTKAAELLGLNKDKMKYLCKKYHL
ncbi:MAG: sigma-54-dependent Fis family transcriptional regulator [Acidobacteria bacterium]|nr:sigma-54-dependent Fis family transcriptional regulator [Acidobacteriota bacterium]